MKRKRLRFLQVTIEPLWDPLTEDKELRIIAQVENEKYTTTRVVRRDDFECLFDLTVDAAKHEIKRLIQSAE